jgi:ribonuclease P protein component
MASPPPTLKKRRDFLACARARRWVAPSLILQARERRGAREAGIDGIRVGYTCSKKVGGAVVRNRAKRRLRAAAAEVLAPGGRDGWDYVLIGRADSTASLPFDRVLADLTKALERVHAPPREKKRAGG